MTDMKAEAAELLRGIESVIDDSSHQPTAEELMGLVLLCRAMIETLAGERDEARSVAGDRMADLSECYRQLAEAERQLAECRADAEGPRIPREPTEAMMMAGWSVDGHP